MYLFLSLVWFIVCLMGWLLVATLWIAAWLLVVFGWVVCVVAVGVYDMFRYLVVGHRRF